MLDVVFDYLLFLLDIDVIKGIDIKIDEEIICLVDDEVFFVLLVFKVMIDLFVGCLIFFCVYFGVFESGLYVLNVLKGKKECIGCIL